MTMRIGLLVPATNSTCEADLARVIPAGVSVHTHRLWLSDWRDDHQSMVRMNEQVETAAEHVCAAGMDVIAYACTSGSFFAGPGHDVEMEQRIRRVGNVPVVVASPATVLALKAVGAKRVSVATPYPAWIAERLHHYYMTAGFEILNVECDEEAAASGARGINDQSPDRIASIARRTPQSGADALFLSCTAWRALEVVEALEDELGIPVVSSNHAIAWACLRALGIDAPLPGLATLGRLPGVASE